MNMDDARSASWQATGLRSPDLVARVRSCLKDVREAQADDYSVSMWEYMLDRCGLAAEEVVRNPSCDPIPYLPVQPEALGLDLAIQQSGAVVARCDPLGEAAGLGPLAFTIEHPDVDLPVSLEILQVASPHAHEPPRQEPRRRSRR